MKLTTKLLAGAVIGVSAVAGWSFMQTLKGVQTRLEAIPQVSVRQLSWSSLTIRVDVLLKNPTKASFSFRFPFVKLYYKGTTIGSSQVLNTVVNVPAYGEVKVENILIQIPMSNVFSVVFALIKALYAKEPVKLTVKTESLIRLGRFVVPYDNSQEITLKN